MAEIKGKEISADVGFRAKDPAVAQAITVPQYTGSGDVPVVNTPPAPVSTPSYENDPFSDFALTPAAGPSDLTKKACSFFSKIRRTSCWC